MKKNQDSVKKKYRKIKLAVAESCRDYCDNTTIHGLKYIANNNLLLRERIFFAVSFILVVFGAVFFVNKAYEKWKYTPIIVSINARTTGITTDPFPAVTICNLNKVYKKKVEQFSINSPEYVKMQLICKHEVNATIANSIPNWNNLNHFIQEISQPCSDMLLRCYFGGVKYNCEDIFQAIITDSGLCCVFNMVHRDFLIKKPVPCHNCKDAKPNGTVYVDWTPEKGYPANLPEKYIPMPAAGIGESLGLSVTLDVEADYYYCSSENSVGFKMLLHNPLELPDMREIGLLLSPGRETKVRIKTVKTESEKHLRSMNKKNRDCFFEDEYNLKNYKVYTQRNCEVECLMNMLLAYCGCVTHYAPLAFANQTVCSIYELSCVNRVQQQSMVAKNVNACPEICWPSCYDLSYLPDFFNTPLAHARFQSSNQFSKNMSSIYMEKNIAVVNIYFKESWYRSSKQNEYIGITDFLSSVGGIIGLFFGFSFISLAEVIYYFVLKPTRIIIATACTKRKMLRNKKRLNKLTLLDAEVTDKAGLIEQRKLPNYEANITASRKDIFLVSKKQVSPYSSSLWRPGMEYTP